MNIDRIAAAVSRLAHAMEEAGFDSGDWGIALRNPLAVERLRYLPSNAERRTAEKPIGKALTWRGDVAGVEFHEIVSFGPAIGTVRRAAEALTHAKRFVESASDALALITGDQP